MSYDTLPEAHEATQLIADAFTGDGDLFQLLTEYIGRMENVQEFLRDTLHPLVNNSQSEAMLGQASAAMMAMKIARNHVSSVHSSAAVLTDSIGKFRLE